MEVSGEIGIFENQKACAPLRKHLFGAKRFAQWWFIAGMAVAVLTAQTLVDLVAPGFGLFGILAAVAGCLFLWFRYARTLAPKARMARGVPASSPIAYRIEDEALVLEGKLSQTRVAWSGISQIAPGNEAWLFIGPGQAWFLPTRFFADRPEEQAFLAACFGKLTGDAQARSAEVAALVAGKAGPWT
ncbi:MAG: YcxB family protein [Caulobacter sp.]|nr:YcxB family protein [Caulobacter sp.]